MARKYVCSPKTGRVIQVNPNQDPYKSLLKNSSYKRKLSRARKSSSKEIKKKKNRRGVGENERAVGIGTKEGKKERGRERIRRTPHGGTKER